MPARRDARGRFVAAGGALETEGTSEAFLDELHASWLRHGAAMIEQVRIDRPHDYLRLMASNLNKQIDRKADALDAMSDDEIADELRRILARLGAESGSPAGTDPGAGARTAETPQPSD